MSSSFLFFVFQRYEIERVIRIGQHDQSKQMDVLSDLLSLFTSGLTFIDISLSVLILLFPSLLSNYFLTSEGIIGNNEEIIEGFVAGGVLDFIGSVISTEKDLRVLVWDFHFLCDCVLFFY